MQTPVDILQSHIKGIGTDIDDNLVGTVKVDYHGQPTLIRNLAAIDKRNKKITITPYDSVVVGEIAKVLGQSGFDAHVYSYKSVVVNIPYPTGETLRKIQAHVKKLGEDAKIAIRNIRRKYKTDDNDKELQQITDMYVKQIDDLIRPVG
jgi:ribosome recycling factor